MRRGLVALLAVAAALGVCPAAAQPRTATETITACRSKPPPADLAAYCERMRVFNLALYDELRAGGAWHGDAMAVLRRATLACIAEWVTAHGDAVIELEPYEACLRREVAAG